MLPSPFFARDGGHYRPAGRYCVTAAAPKRARLGARGIQRPLPEEKTVRRQQPLAAGRRGARGSGGEARRPEASRGEFVWDWTDTAG